MKVRSITIFSVPKAFSGHTATIQQNAIKSWTLLEPRPDILLMGNETLVMETAQALGARYVSNLETNEFGTPLLSSVFKEAKDNSSSEILIYVNCDVILFTDIITQLNRIPLPDFLMVGQRCNLDISDNVFEETEDWQTRLKNTAEQAGSFGGIHAMDYFAFTKNVFPEVPDFALGRTSFDNWMIYYALKRGIVLVDATESVLAIHQNHDYSHHIHGKEGVFRGLEAQRNLALLGGWDNAYYSLNCADYKLTAAGLIKPKRTSAELVEYHKLLSKANHKVWSHGRIHYYTERAITLIWEIKNTIQSYTHSYCTAVRRMLKSVFKLIFQN